MVELVRARWRLACASARDGLRGKARVCWCAWRLEGEGSRVLVRVAEGSLVLVLATLLVECMLVRGAHELVAAYVQDILVVRTKNAKALCASTTILSYIVMDKHAAWLQED